MNKIKYLVILIAVFLVGLPFFAKPEPIKVLGESIKQENIVSPISPTPEPTKPPQIIYVQPQIYIGTTPAPTIEPVQNVTHVTNIYAPTPTITKTPNSSPAATIEPVKSPTPTKTPNTITIKSGSKNWSANFISGDSAFDIIKKAVGSGLTYDIYDCCGAFITGFDGKSAVYPKWWEFFVNGSSSSVGVSYYIPVSGDILEFKFHDE